MARRSGWSNLSASYRRRLKGAGITREQWIRGADLRKARGHAPRPRGAAPAEIAERAGRSQMAGDDQARIERWRSREAPDWLSRQAQPAMSSDVAAVLSQIGIPPERWSTVIFQPHDDGTWGMTVVPTRGYPRSVTLPDRTAAMEVLWMLEPYRAEDIVDVDIYETDQVAS